MKEKEAIIHICVNVDIITALILILHQTRRVYCSFVNKEITSTCVSEEYYSLILKETQYIIYL